MNVGWGLPHLVRMVSTVTVVVVVEAGTVVVVGVTPMQEQALE